MVTHWGMSQKLGPVSYKMSDDDPFLGGQMHKSRQFSEHTMEVIDEEVHKILDRASKSALELLTKHREGLQAVTDGLMKNEELDRHQIADLLGPSVHKEKEAELPNRPPVLNKKTEDESGQQPSEPETETQPESETVESENPDGQSD
jgi:cell division protease FtsH